MQFLVVDDHPMIREGLVGVLRQLEPLVVVLQATDGQTAIHQINRLNPHETLSGALIDLNMPGLSGASTVAQLRAAKPDLPILVFSSSEDPADVRRAFAAGASGYCPKSSGNDTLLAALHMVLNGQKYVPPLMLESEASPTEPQPRPFASLTERQAQVLVLMAQGQPNKLIARQLDMQEKTVKGHISAIFRSLGVVNRVQAVEAARQAGLLSLPQG